MGGKSKAQAATKDKAAEKEAKARAKLLTDFLKFAKAGDRAKVESAIAAGVDVNHANEKGQTAAHYAAAFGHLRLLRLLHDKGADFSLQTSDHNRLTPLAAARFIGEEQAAKLIEALIAGTAVDVDDGGSDDEEDDSDDGETTATGASTASGLLVASKGTRRAIPHGKRAVAQAPAAADDELTPRERIDTTAHVASRSEAIDKSESDGRAYRWLRLTNELEVMLVSDATCDYAAAAMDVGVGSASEPEALPGLAHFLEHMLFLGTSKYPAEDAFTSFLEERGGSYNAFTAHEDTLYYFDVQHASLRGALDRFAQFFTCPLFTPEATEREMQAVDSEFAKNKQSDAWRLQQLGKSAADPRHPWARFNAGNLETPRARRVSQGALLGQLDALGRARPPAARRSRAARRALVRGRA